MGNGEDKAHAVHMSILFCLFSAEVYAKRGVLGVVPLPHF